MNPENTSKQKTLNENSSEFNEKDSGDDYDGADLGIPGAELDDVQENVGSEDEENNLYSLGGDNHDYK